MSAAVDGSLVVGLAIAGPRDDARRRELLAVGVAPAFRRRGLAGALLGSCVTGDATGEVEFLAEVTLAERDPIEPLDRALRASVARRLLERAGFEIRPTEAELERADPAVIRAVRPSEAGPVPGP